LNINNLLLDTDEEMDGHCRRFKARQKVEITRCAGCGGVIDTQQRGGYLRHRGKTYHDKYCMEMDQRGGCRNCGG